MAGSVPRLCDGCGSKMVPRQPRTRQPDGQMWCSTCVENDRHIQSTAAGWSHEDIIRHEIGRQKVHTVGGTTELCPQHLRIHQSQSAASTDLAAMVGLDHSYDQTTVGPPHEGRCEACARQYGADAKSLPWENQHGTPHRITPVRQERQVPPRVLDEDGGVVQRGRWPHRPHSPNRTERMIPVDTTIQSLNRRRTAAADDEHPDLSWKRRTFGTANTSLGRAGFARHHTAGVLDHEFDDPGGWNPPADTHFNPVHNIIEGARAYAGQKGLADPHAQGYGHIMQTPKMVRAIAEHYDNMPDHDARAHPAFQALAHEIRHQHHFLENRMGIKMESADHDPYANVHEMMHDVVNNKRIKVLGTHVTGSHPALSDHENDMFRAVHDVFGHAATGRNFDRHGEDAAYHAHSRMFSHPLAKQALGTDLRGQNSSLILNGDYTHQKLGLLPHHLLGDVHELARHGILRRAVAFRMGDPAKLLTRSRIRVQAHDSGDGETIFHCPFCGSGQVIARSDGTVECEFCTTAFTVQVQPQMPAFPQTIDGMPVDVPGMPAGGANANVPPGSADSGSPFEDGAAGSPDEAAEDGGEDESEDSGDEPPAFLKGSAYFRTDRGGWLTGNAYARRLALAHLGRKQVLEKIHEERSA